MWKKKRAGSTSPEGTLAGLEEAHMRRLQELCHLNSATIIRVARRNASRQRPRRQLELHIRQGVVAFSTRIAERGWTLAERAHRLHLSPRTLRQWQADFRHDRLRVQPLGRPLVRSSAQQRNEILALLEELGPATGLPTLQGCFPDRTRAELEDLLKRYRRLWRKRHGQALHVLTWPVPGSVWAMDFTEAPRPIDGQYAYLLAVRDLASSFQLLWLPVQDQTAPEAWQALASLFVLHGAPLVLKIDNGSALIAEATQTFLHQAGVIPLFSPPRLPSYNGAVEAGTGSLKTRTEVQATLHGRPGQWTWDDVAAAPLEANATARPRGLKGPTPEALWAQRRPITPEDRMRFRVSVDRCRCEARQEAGWSMEQLLIPHEERSLDRKAIRRALVEHGYLLFSRRRIPLPIHKRKVTNKT
jgi:transposase InsO family protein